MSLLFRSKRASLSDFTGRQTGLSNMPIVTADSAMRHSAVWASSRLRADLISSLPLDVYRKVGGIQVEQTPPKVLTATGGPDCLYNEWAYSSQMDLDRFGNDFGFIVDRDGMNLPSQIELVSASDVTVRIVKGVKKFRIRGDGYDAKEIWHERQYTVPGLPVGLSPIAHAAMTIAQGLTAQQFAVRWYSGNAMPAAVLRNSERTLTRKAAIEAKDSFEESMRDGGTWATGKDWEYSPVVAQSNDQQYLNAMGASIADIARFMGVPADMIDAPVQGSSITYANITQRNLQLLVINLGPAINRREKAFSSALLAQPRFVKMNTDALVRMDPAARSTMLGEQVRDMRKTHDEARALDDLPPLTDEQIARETQITAALKAAAKPTPGGTTP